MPRSLSLPIAFALHGGASDSHCRQSNMGFGMCGAKSKTQTPQQALDLVSTADVRFWFQAGSGACDMDPSQDEARSIGRHILYTPQAHAETSSADMHRL